MGRTLWLVCACVACVRFEGWFTSPSVALWESLGQPSDRPSLTRKLRPIPLLHAEEEDEPPPWQGRGGWSSGGRGQDGAQAGSEAQGGVRPQPLEPTHAVGPVAAKPVSSLARVCSGGRCGVRWTVDCDGWSRGCKAWRGGQHKRRRHRGYWGHK